MKKNVLAPYNSPVSRLVLILGLAALAAGAAVFLLTRGGPEPDLDTALKRSAESPPPAPPEDLPPPRFGAGQDEPPLDDRPRTPSAGASAGAGAAATPEPPVVTDLESVRALIEAKETNSALRALDRMIEANPDDGPALAVRGKLHLDLGWYRHAERDLASASRLNDENPQGLLTHAEALLRLRRSREAEALVRRSLELEPEQARAHALLAVMLLRDKNTVAAEKELREAARIDPEEPLTKALSGE